MRENTRKEPKQKPSGRVPKEHVPGFPVIRVGSAMRIPREKLVLWIESQADEKNPDENPKIVGI